MTSYRPASPGKAARRRRAVPASATTTSSSRRTKAEAWETDDDEHEDGASELVDGPATVERSERRTAKSASARTTTVSRARVLDSQDWGRPLRQSLRLLRRVLTAFLPFLAPLLPYLLFFTILWLSIIALRSYMTSYILSLPSVLHGPLGRILAAIPAPRILLPSPRQVYSLVALPSSLFGAIRSRSTRSPSFELLSASAAQSANERAHHALDVFDNLLRLSSPEGPNSLALEPVAIWELSAAVKYSSALDDRDFLANQLAELGDLSRNVKDSVIELNAQGLNAFSFILNDFTRLETLLTSLAASKKRVSAKERSDFERLLEVLFDRISDSLGSLLVSLDRAIPTATLASDSAHKIFTSFEREKSVKTNEWEDLPWPSRLLDAAGSGSKKARLLRKDLELTEASAFAVRNVWKGLDKTRDALKSYQHNVGFYKAGIVGSHLAAHGLSLENEVEGLKGVMAQMRNALDEAKHVGGAGGRSRQPAGLPASSMV